jgi:hypothetical protein
MVFVYGVLIALFVYVVAAYVDNRAKRTRRLRGHERGLWLKYSHMAAKSAEQWRTQQ